MDTLLPVVCLLTGVLLTLGTLYLLLRRGFRQLQVANAYREVAEQLGLQVDTRGVSVRGFLGDRRVWIGDVMVGHGTERRTEVRGVVALERPLGLGVQIRRAGRLTRRRGAPVTLGDADLDRRLAIGGDDPERVRHLLAPPVRDALRSLVDRWPDVLVTDEDVEVRLKSPELTSFGLQALLTAMTRLADALEDARRDVPPPEELRPWLEPWERLAASLGLDFHPWLPALSGRLHGRRVLVVPRRDADRYGLALEVWFQPHPELGLLLRPQVEPDGYWSVGQDIQVGDPRFDEAFVIKGWDPVLVSARLGELSRDLLLDLAARGPLVVDDRGLHLRIHDLEPAKIRAALEQACAAAKAMGW